MRKGALIYNEESGRMDIRFGLEEYYGGLHCGESMEVMVGSANCRVSFLSLHENEQEE